MPLLRLISFLKHETVIETFVRTLSVKNVGDSFGPPKRAKTTPIPRITLVSGEQVSISTVEEAQKIAKRRDLKLVKILDLDTKTQRPIYKLMTATEYHSEDLKQREERKKQKQNSIKGEKVLSVNGNISNHDLNTLLNKLNKWLTKHYEVKVVISGDANSMDKAETIYTTFENHLKKDNVCKILQKRQKGNMIKFQIMPTIQKSAEIGTNTS